MSENETATEVEHQPSAEPRRVVVVDCETSALVPRTVSTGLLGQPTGTYGVAVEIAWHDMTTDERGAFVPAHFVRAVRANGDAKALVVSRYLERLVDVPHDDGTALRRLHETLTGATLAGANPAFDARFLRATFERLLPRLDPEPWHHRLLDLSAYAAGALGLPPGDLPGLARCCELLGIVDPDHTAAGDVEATVACFRSLEFSRTYDIGADRVLRSGPSRAAVDPLAHVRADDRPDPTPEVGPFCSSTRSEFSCTREPGHPGQHIAGAGRYVGAVWPAP